MGKKLAAELSLPLAGLTLYVDADVLFFARARELSAAPLEGVAPRYLRDCGPYLDERLITRARESRDPVNGGAFLVHERLRWERALARLATLRGPPSFFTEQTLLHLAMHASGARALDPARHVVSRTDELRLADEHAGPGIVLRHYTTPIRHKLWCAVGRGLTGEAARDGGAGHQRQEWAPPAVGLRPL
jgi:hypothetical protein